MAGRGGRSTHSGSPGPTSIAPGNSTSSFRPLPLKRRRGRAAAVRPGTVLPGASPDDAAFGAWLDQHGIHDRPHAAPGVDGHGAASDETLREARLSEIDENERHGVALIYESRESGRAFPPKLRAGLRPQAGGLLRPGRFRPRRIPGRASFRLALRRTGAGSGKLRPDRPPRAAWTAGGTLGRQGLASEHQLHGGRRPRRHRACAQAESLRSGDDRRRFIGSIPERARPKLNAAIGLAVDDAKLQAAPGAAGVEPGRTGRGRARR